MALPEQWWKRGLAHLAAVFEAEHGRGPGEGADGG